MSKEDKKEGEEIVDNPFAGFTLLDTPKVESVKPLEDVNKKTTGKADVGGVEETPEQITAREAEEARLAAADKALADVAAKQAKALDKKNGIQVEEDDDAQLEEDEETEDDTFSYKPFLSDLGERGLLLFDESEFKDEDFKSEEVVDKVVVKTITKGIQDWKDRYSDTTKTLLEYEENGGDPKDFISTWYGQTDWSTFKVESEATQKAAIRESLKLADYSPEEIEDEISLYEDSGKLESKAKIHLAKLQKFEDASKKDLIERQKAYQIQQEAANKKYYEDLHKHWFDKEDLNGFKLNKTLKDKVWDTIYKIDKKTGKTALQESYENNVDAQFMYALLVANNFDMSKFEKQVENKVTSKIRKSLNGYTDQRQKTTGGSRTEKEEKPDAEAGFGAFRRIA